MPEPRWELLRTFAAASASGSLSGAARALAIRQSTASRHIAELEASVGGTLFVRTPHGLRPTELAAALLPHAEAMMGAASALARAASGVPASVIGTVRITASEMIGGEVLPPIIAELMAMHPELRVELVLDNAVRDLGRGDADIAVRMVRPTQGSLVTRKVGEVALGLYAARSYLHRRGIPESPAELGRHVLIGFDRETPPSATSP